MKVRLAVQALSSSVVHSLDFCRHDLGLEEFKHAEATAKFIRELDMVFDYLNSSNPNGSGYKAVLTRQNISDRAALFEYFARRVLKFTILEKKQSRAKLLISER